VRQTFTFAGWKRIRLSLYADVQRYAEVVLKRDGFVRKLEDGCATRCGPWTPLGTIDTP
jgi:hypothetical protein